MVVICLPHRTVMREEHCGDPDVSLAKLCRKSHDRRD